MQSNEIKPLSPDGVSYEGPPLVELERDGVAYRVDVGRGSAIAVSRREVGSWDWTPVVEGRWDGSRLRARGLDFTVVEALAAALRERAEEGVE